MYSNVFPSPDNAELPDQVQGKQPRHFQLNLDDNPIDRWNIIVPQQKNELYKIANDTLILIKANQQIKQLKQLDPLTNKILRKMGEYGDEIIGIAKILDLTTTELLFFNIFAEFNSACTSIITMSKDGQPIHGRNLDEGRGLEKLVANIDVQKNNKIIFKSTFYVGLVGVFTALKPSEYSITYNQRHQSRFKQFWTKDLGLFEELLQSLLGGIPLTHMMRDAMTNINTYTGALDYLSKTELICGGYITICGINKYEAAVITRDSNKFDIYPLKNNIRWFIVQTNWDHQQIPEVTIDDRRSGGMQHMELIGIDKMDENNLFNVMRQSPVMWIQNSPIEFDKAFYSTQTSIINPRTNYYNITVWFGWLDKPSNGNF